LRPKPLHVRTVSAAAGQEGAPEWKWLTRRFRDRRIRLYSHLGGGLSDVQKIAVERICRGEWK
jgi:hypothetical protein